MAKKLLVADDSLTIQKVIKLALSNDNYEIQTLTDGSQAIEQISLFRPDVVLIDIALQGLSAFDIKKQANTKEDLKNIPFILMSSAFEKIDEARVALLQFDGRLTKPFDPTHLREVLNKAIQIREKSQAGKLPPPAPTPAPPAQPPSVPRSDGPSLNLRSFHQQEEKKTTGEIALADPIWSDSTDLTIDAPLDIPPPPMSTDSDIKKLTETTVKMSGLDDLSDWGLSETHTQEAPLTDVNFFSEPKEESTPPFLKVAEDPKKEIEHTSVFEKPVSLDLPSSAALSTLPSTAEIEELVEKQVKAQLEEMMRKTIPEITERVIKQEIRRLLDGLA